MSNSGISNYPPLPAPTMLLKNKQLSGLGKAYRVHKIQHCLGGRGGGTRGDEEEESV